MDVVKLITDKNGNHYFMNNQMTQVPIRFYGNWFIAICRDCFIVTGKHNIQNGKLIKFGELEKCLKCDSENVKREETTKEKWIDTKLGDSPLVAAQMSKTKNLIKNL